MVDFGICRVSSEEQAKGGLSIQAQIDELLKHSERYPDKDLKEENIFKAEGHSGGFKTDAEEYHLEGTKFSTIRDLKDRPDLIQLLKVCKMGDRIFITRFDRLGRNFSFLEELILYFRKLGIEVCPLNDNNEEIVRQILSVLGQWERSKTISRNADIQKSLFDKGIHPYKAPTGYNKNTKDSKGRLKYPKEPEGILIINEKEAEMVEDIFALTPQGIGYKTICSKWKIQSTTYYNILHNKIYYGIIKHKGEEKQGIHKPIITAKEWENANKKT